MTVAAVTLDDKYTAESGRVYLTAVQALVRLPLVQRRRDLAAGINTGGFISGYRGSPLGGYDEALWRAKTHLAAHNVHFQPGLNEELAATAVWGSQQLNLFPGATVDGVFGIWYGKGPGVDRAVDAFKHANLAGASRHGGVLAIAGDDHGCQSSTLPHQSEYELMAAMMPVLNPATVQDYLDFGLLGFALSRFSGCWIGIKATSETAESSATVLVDPARPRIVLPEDFAMPPGGLNIRWPDPALEQERRLHGPRMEAVAAFARANGLDRRVFDPRAPRLGIVATGKAWLDVCQALDDLGLGREEAEALGIRLHKVGLSWPLEAEGARRFADGLADILVVEEKRGVVEEQLARILFNLPADRRPTLVGKRDETGAPLLPGHGELSATMVAGAILARLERLGASEPRLRERHALMQSYEKPEGALAAKAQRTAYFCSGCPHNTSTNVPEGSRAVAGIGCHTLAIYMGRRTETLTQMGGEGAPWIGQAPFTSEKHVFANLGDGTYAHSGLLAIRAAAAAGVNITFKILYNDAVAMTGGQPVEGGLTVPAVARQVVAEGARQVVIVTDEPGKYPLSADIPAGIAIRDRDELDQVQRELREVPGLTVLIYDQTCAAEKRRRRKRGQFPDPQVRAVINEAVCEGCGDCQTASNCISVLPLETPFGRKRTIDQSSCNKDLSCVNGFCPSFVTVHGGRLRRPAAKADGGFDPAAGLPDPELAPLAKPYGILVTGIGGTGVVTLGALLGMAAHLEGKGCTVLDVTGLSQKNGAVTSHIRLAPGPEDTRAIRIGAGGADALLACDMVVAAGAAALSRLASGRTRAVVNSHLQPTGAFVRDGDTVMDGAAMRRALGKAAGEGRVDFVDGTGLATALMGDAIAANLFMLGFAFQKGLIPLSFAAIDRAIELNGVAIAANRKSFAWGRRAALDPSAVTAAAGPAKRAEVPEREELPALIERRAAFLAAYQNAAYAGRYRAFVDAVRRAEQTRAGGRSDLTEAVARGLFKLMAYKDEYEVARLHSDGAFTEKLRRQFEGDFRLQFHLAPPLFARRDPVTGHLQKRSYGRWMMTAFRLLAKLRVLRGTPFDPFGHTAERRAERALIADYEATIERVLGTLAPANHEIAVAIARLPERIRGYGHIKDAAIAKIKEEEAALLAAYRSPAPQKKAAE